ncbi:MAG: glycoside hydrolase family 28 protein [Bacteroidota bacterium]
MKRNLLMNLLIVSGLFFVTSLVYAGTDPAVNAYTSNLPFIMPEIEVPNIPANWVAITDFGAVGDGVTMNTGAIADAIQHCSTKGGGVVTVPPGMWLTGPIKLESNIELHLDSGAVILFSKRFEDYPMFKRPKISEKCVPMIYGGALHDVAITGRGLIDGSGQYWRPVKKEKMTSRQWKDMLASGGAVSPDGKTWWPSKEALNGEDFLKGLKKENTKPTPEQIAGAREFLRPVMVALDDCKRVLFDGPTFTNAPGWTLAPTRCEQVVIRNVTVNNPWWGQNTDALDINSCRNFLLYKSMMSVGDDAICLKPGQPSDSHSGEPSCENIVVADCIVYSGHGGFVIGSGSVGGARNISVKNCTFIGTDIGLRFKSAIDRGGVIEKVYVDGIRMKDIVNEAIFFDMFYDQNNDNDPNVTRIPEFRDFQIQNVICDGASAAIFIRGLPEMPVKNIRLSNIVINSATGCLLQDAEHIEMNNIRLSFLNGPVCTVNNADSVQLNKIAFPPDATLFLKVSGNKTKAISIGETDLSKMKQTVDLAPEVNKDEIIIR